MDVSIWITKDRAFAGVVIFDDGTFWQ